MAIFDTVRLRDILVRGKVAAEAPAAEFVSELDRQLEDALSGFASLDRMALMEARLLQAIAEAKAEAAEQAAQQARHINQATGIVLAGIALAVGIILGFG